jgi:hypothetical protein
MRISRIAPLLVVALCACATTTTRAQWQRPDGTARYRFTSTEEGAGGVNRLEVGVELRTASGEPETIMLTDASTARAGGASNPVELSPECIAEFGGDARALGRIALTIATQPHDAAPPCIPEELFGAVTDLITIFLVQTPAFPVDSHAQTGDSVRFAGFETDWQRQAPELNARVVATGGTMRLLERSETQARIRWLPDSMALSIARRIGPEQAILMRGWETFGLELRIDPRSGALLGAHALEDRLNMRMWMISGRVLPPLAPDPSAPGAPLVIRRTLALERLLGKSCGLGPAGRASASPETTPARREARAAPMPRPRSMQAVSAVRPPAER